MFSTITNSRYLWTSSLERSVEAVNQCECLDSINLFVNVKSMILCCPFVLSFPLKIRKKVLLETREEKPTLCKGHMFIECNENSNWPKEFLGTYGRFTKTDGNRVPFLLLFIFTHGEKSTLLLIANFKPKSHGGDAQMERREQVVVDESGHDE